MYQINAYDMSVALVPLLETSHPAEARVEALRVFGNLTRWQETRDFLAHHRGKNVTFINT
jgi:hypothetical protein